MGYKPYIERQNFDDAIETMDELVENWSDFDEDQRKNTIKDALDTLVTHDE